MTRKNFASAPVVYTSTTVAVFITMNDIFSPPCLRSKPSNRKRRSALCDSVTLANLALFVSPQKYRRGKQRIAADIGDRVPSIVRTLGYLLTEVYRDTEKYEAKDGGAVGFMVRLTTKRRRTG